MKHNTSVAVLGAGAWGTAIAVCASPNVQHVVLFERNPQKAEVINMQHKHATYFDDLVLPANIMATSELASLRAIQHVVIAVPMQQVRALMVDLVKVQFSHTPTFIICCKGIEKNSNKLCSQIISEFFPDANIAALAGPNFANEVARGIYSQANIACADLHIATQLINLFSTPSFHITPIADLIGVQIAGAFKNVIAIAAGIALGLGWQENARAAIITQGTIEMANLCMAMGGNATTLLSAAGVGDLFLTCTSRTSRNTEFGFHLGQGASLANLLAVQTTIEGYNTVLACWQLASALNLQMPLVQAVYDILYQNASVALRFDMLSGGS